MKMKSLIIGLLILGATLICFANEGETFQLEGDPNFYIFLCFGQSNMESGGTMNDEDKVVDERFRVMADFDNPGRGWVKDHWYHALPPLTARGRGICMIDSFGKTLVANLPGNVRVGVIKVSVPGCKIELFDKDTFETCLANEQDWMKNLVKQYNGNPYQYLVDMAKVGQKDGVIKGILLHQGESNPNDHQWPNKVKAIYDNLMVDLNLNPEDVPFLAGETVNADQGGACAGFNEIMAELPKIHPNSYVISSAGCPTNDHMHFNSEGSRMFGKRYAEQMLSLISGDESQSHIDPSMPLKKAYAGKFLIGAAGDIPWRYSDEELANIKAHYDIITPENCMKPQPTQPTKGEYNFTATDALVEWCEQNGIKVWGHTLGWHAQTPSWFLYNPPSEEQLAEQTSNADNRRGRFGRRRPMGPPLAREVALGHLKDHIMTVAGRYKGRITGWDVFNESIADGGDGSTENLRKNSWYQVVGPDVLTLAFKWAHEAAPDAQLYYNDYNIEQGAVENKGKHASSMLLLKRLIAEGAPITGVGIQGHWHLDTNLADVEKAITNYASLGLRVAITELDVTATGDNSGAFGVRQGNRTIPPENYQKQAEVYQQLFEIFMRHADVIDRVTFWGISDTRSWRGRQNALLFDGQLQPKAAFKAVLEAAAN